MPEPLPASIQSLLTRRSVGPRGLTEPAPPPEVLQLAAEAALRAPDHQGLRPFRFVHVDADRRESLGSLFEQAAIAQGRDAEGVAGARARALVGPGLLAVIAHIRNDVPDVPPHEQWLCVGAGVMNLLNVLHLAGYGAKVLGGSMARAPAVRHAFCHEAEQIACWVICGTPVDPAPEAPARQARDLLLDW